MPRLGSASAVHSAALQCSAASRSRDGVANKVTFNSNFNSNSTHFYHSIGCRSDYILHLYTGDIVNNINRCLSSFNEFSTD